MRGSQTNVHLLIEQLLLQETLMWNSLRERVVKDKEMTNLKVTRSWMMTSGIQRNYYKETTSFEVLDEKS